MTDQAASPSLGFGPGDQSMATYETTHGSIVHIDLNSDDAEATRAFYGKAFGWSFEAFGDMAYHLFRAPSPPNGGIMARQEGEFQPPATVLYLNVDDLAETRAAITEAGGQVLVEEIEVPEMGVFCMFRDPGGIVQAAWEDRYEGEPPEGGWPKLTDEPQPGAYCFFELYSEDPPATQAFYTSMFGWTFEDDEDGGYRFANPPTPPTGGLMEAGDHMPAGSLPYVLVASAEDACQAIDAAGGTVLREPFEVGGWGTMAVFEAPGGIVQAVWVSAADA